MVCFEDTVYIYTVGLKYFVHVFFFLYWRKLDYTFFGGAVNFHSQAVASPN